MKQMIEEARKFLEEQKKLERERKEFDRIVDDTIKKHATLLERLDTA